VDLSGENPDIGGRRSNPLMRNRAFVVDYASACEGWRNGVPTVFPAGTYWLQRFASVPVLEI